MNISSQAFASASLGAFPSASVCLRNSRVWCKQVPRGVVLVMADPDREIVGDPASGKQTADAVGRRLVLEIIADPLRSNLRILDAVCDKARGENGRRRRGSTPSSFRRRE